MNIDQARFNMVEQQVRTWEVLDARVLEVLQQVPREDFVPARYTQLAFADLNIPLGQDQIMMRPVVEGRMLQTLDLQGNESVLEIGTGSGFITACLATLAASVHSVEYYESFTKQAQEKLREWDHARADANIKLFTGDVMGDWEPGQQYDVIVVTGSVPELPQRFVQWLRPGGRLFVVIGESPLMEAVVFTRSNSEASDQELQSESFFETDLPPLIHSTRPEPFKF